MLKGTGQGSSTLVLLGGQPRRAAVVRPMCDVVRDGCQAESLYLNAYEELCWVDACMRFVELSRSLHCTTQSTLLNLTQPDGTLAQGRLDLLPILNPRNVNCSAAATPPEGILRGLRVHYMVAPVTDLKTRRHTEDTRCDR